MDPPDTSTHMSPAAAADRIALAIASGSVVDIGGVPLLLRAEGHERAAIIAALLGASRSWPTDPLGVLELTVDGAARPTSPPDIRYTPVEVWHNADGLVAATGALVAEAKGTEARIGGHHASLPTAVRQVLPAMLTWLLAQHDAFVLHAAAIVIDDVAVLVVGPTGAGKSTLAALTMEAGLPVLGDDLVAARRRGDDLEVRGIARALAIPRDVQVARPTYDIADLRDRVGMHGSALDQLPHRVGGVIEVGHGDDSFGELSRMDARQCLDIVVGSFFGSTSDSLVRRLYPTAAALARLPAWRYRHPLAAEARPAAAERLIDRLRQEL